LWVVVGQVMGLNLIYFAGVAVVAGLLVYEHRLVRAEDMSRVGMAFQTMNGIISVVYFAFILADLLILGDATALLKL
jgi:4-hydroxybenzoate polyprenyltransferase